MAWFWLIAGPNGSGKTTLVQRGVLQNALPSLPRVALNADAVTALLVQAGVARDTANLGAARLIDAMAAETVAQGLAVLVETVLSSDKYLPLVETARVAGLRTGLLFVTVDAADRNLLRVHSRARTGGHDVPPDKVLARRARSHANFWRFADAMDLALLFDNSSPGHPVLVATRSAGSWNVYASDRLPDLAPELRRRAG